MNRKNYELTTRLTMVCGICAASMLAQVVSAQNLVVNGDFGLGTNSFESDYNYTLVSTGGGAFTVSSNPSSWNGNFSSPPVWFDHSPTSDGLSLLADGSPTANQDFWRQTVAVSQNTLYKISAWTSNLQSGGPPDPGLLQFFINGVAVGSPFTVPSGGTNWQEFSAMWNSTAATSATLSIQDLNTAPGANDFAVDDISFVAVPEPSTLLLTGFGLVCLLVRRNRSSVHGIGR